MHADVVAAAAVVELHLLRNAGIRTSCGLISSHFESSLLIHSEPKPRTRRRLYRADGEEEDDPLCPRNLEKKDQV